MTWRPCTVHGVPVCHTPAQKEYMLEVHRAKKNIEERRGRGGSEKRAVGIAGGIGQNGGEAVDGWPPEGLSVSGKTETSGVLLPFLPSSDPPAALPLRCPLFWRPSTPPFLVRIFSNRPPVGRPVSALGAPLYLVCRLRRGEGGSLTEWGRCDMERGVRRRRGEGGQTNERGRLSQPREREQNLTK